MALAKKCDRCGKFYDHYPNGNKSQSNAIRKVQKDATGGTLNAFANWVIDLMQLLLVRRAMVDLVAEIIMNISATIALVHFIAQA